jgi:hypothetical protein
MTQCIDASRLPVHEQPAAFGAIKMPPADSPHKLTRMLFPSYELISNAFWRHTAEARSAVVGIACERFRQKHNRWPNDLAELTPSFITAIPLDPYDGTPLKYKKLDDGIVVYSGGKLRSNSVRPELPEGIDIGFRLWNPDQRRLPPLPDPLPPEGEPVP